VLKKHAKAIHKALVVLEEEYDRLDGILDKMDYMHQHESREIIELQGLSMAIRYLEHRITNNS
jgi:hypothetical protein